ncbi:hypothetical protein [Amycolatopsis sp. cmx-11-12]|uniref:hypothetical protein n=1 Tax=Amycolatopsis sp. cmx-11-12 TaxID=2785795 RepID=UPI0039182FB6
MSKAAVAAMVLASLLVPGTASGAEQGCGLVSPEEGAVLHKGGSYRFEVNMSRDFRSDEDGDWSLDYVVNDYSISMETLVWVRFEDGTRSTSVKVRIVDR